MPIYEYECLSCGEHFDALQKLSDAPLAECRLCSGNVRKLLGTPALQFKGSGWYITDYAGKSPAPAAGAPSPDAPACAPSGGAPATQAGPVRPDTAGAPACACPSNSCGAK